MNQFKPYTKRAIKCLELAEVDGWRLKIYGINATSRKLPEKLIVDGKNAALSQLPRPAITDQRYGVGFLIIHRGAMANWFLLNWWGYQDIVQQKLFSSPSNDPDNVSPVEDKSIMACVYELDIYHFESKALVENVLSDTKDPNFEAYLQQQLNTEI